MTDSFIKAVQSEPGTTYGRLLGAMRGTIRDGQGMGRRLLPGRVGSFVRKMVTSSSVQEPQLCSSETKRSLEIMTGHGKRLCMPCSWNERRYGLSAHGEVVLQLAVGQRRWCERWCCAAAVAFGQRRSKCPCNARKQGKGGWRRRLGALLLRNLLQIAAHQLCVPPDELFASTTSVASYQMLKKIQRWL